MVGVLSSTLSEAIEWGWLESNVCIGIERNETKSRSRDVSDEEYQAVRKIAPLRVRLAMDFTRYTGQLQGDIISLRWAQVHEHIGTILFRHFKTHKKIQVQITPEVQEILDQCKRFKKKGDYVLAKHSGDGYTSEGIRACWQRVMQKWDLTGNDRFTFHDIKKIWVREQKKPSSRRDVESAIEGYPQFDAGVRAEAAEMSHHYEVFYCLEQSIRKLITDTLQSAAGADWWNSGKIPQKIHQDVADRAQREIDSGITRRSGRMIDYTTFGELSQIITSNWDIFGLILTSRKAVEKVMGSLNLLRGPIAHCCPVSKDEADRLALAVKDWFRMRS